MPPKSTTLVDLRNDLRELLAQRLQMETALTYSVVFIVSDYLKLHWGGGNMYVPKEDTLEDRDLEMWEYFNGSNYKEVGDKFGLCTKQVRNRFKLVREVMTKKNQPGLFGE